MNKDSLREYIFAAQRGDRKALVELLTYSWGIVHYQCGKLLLFFLHKSGSSQII